MPGFHFWFLTGVRLKLGLVEHAKGHVRSEVGRGCGRVRDSVSVRASVRAHACACACVRALVLPVSQVKFTWLLFGARPQCHFFLLLVAGIQVTSWACSSFRADEISKNFGCQSCQWEVEVSFLGMRVSLLFVAENACPGKLQQIIQHGSCSGYRDKPRLGFLASTPAPSHIFIVISESGHSSFYWIVSDVGTNYSPYIKFSTNTEMPQGFHMEVSHPLHFS